ncbi:hypothetical protein MSAS_48320 [Mycobacterium saskatchewanense]|uniref:hypothetical protein n=1 Tax=Mycobacterium saskatchewanense TaxID=220927 RepID=UPI00130266C9|nr:hypothetical protein [Mycobacterium saskatchewanense]BBX65658.1 hypothetical protein MSAS_48320 [Mycobacterium saskatchewanense]
MTAFAGKAAAPADKVRGGYDSPAPVVRCIAPFVVASTVAHCRAAWRALRDRRKRRGAR